MTAVIITRPNTSIEQSTTVYKNAGFEVFQAPGFAIKTCDTVKAQWLHAPADVWILLSVHALEHALIIAPEWAPSQQTKIIAVGPAVEKAWVKHFDHSITSHIWMNSEGVIELLKNNKPKSVKILTTADGRDIIKRHCMQAHISYAQINTYLRIPLSTDQVGLQDLYQKETNKPVILTATSSGILSQFMSQLSTDLQAKVLSQPIVVGARRIADLAEKMGFVDIHVATSPSDQDMCEAVKKLY